MASRLLETCQQAAVRVFLYVQTSNNSAVEFYSRRNFKICETVENYYRRTDCDSAYKMEYSSN